jgi:hypothetical protein
MTAPRCFFVAIRLSLFLLGAGNLFAQKIQPANGYYGVVQPNGSYLIPAIYQNIQELVPNFYAVKDEKGLWGFYTGKKKTTECIYDNFRTTSSSHILVQKNGRWGIIDQKGTLILEHRYRYLTPAGTHKYKAGLYNQWCLRTFDNKIVHTFEYDSIRYLGNHIYRFCLAGQYGLLDSKGKLITTEFQDLYEAAQVEKEILPLQAPPDAVASAVPYKIPQAQRFDSVYHFSEGFAKFRMGNKYGFVDSVGNIRLVPQYTRARNFSEGMVAVVLMGRWGFMDKNEKLCVQPNFEEVSDFKNGVSIVRRGTQYNFIDKQGKLLYNEPFEKVIPTPLKNFLLIRNYKTGIADAYGQEFISTKYETIVELDNSFFLAQEHGLWGVLNQQGSIVLPFNYFSIQYIPSSDLIITMEPGVEKTVVVK